MGDGSEQGEEECCYWFERPWQDLPHVNVLHVPGLTKEAFEQKVRKSVCMILLKDLPRVNVLYMPGMMKEAFEQQVRACAYNFVEGLASCERGACAWTDKGGV